MHLCLRHGCFARDVPSAGTHSLTSEVSAASTIVNNVILCVASHSNVYDEKVCSGYPCQRVNSRSASAEVGDHLRRYLLWIGAHAFCRDTMIGSKNDNAPARRPWFQTLLNRAEAAGDLFKTTKTAGRLSQLELPRFSASNPLVLNGRNAVKRVR